MADENKKTVEDPYTKESDADSEAYTQERIEAGQEKLQVQQEQARQQFVFLGEPEPEIEIPNPEDRPLDWESMTEAEKQALETQNAIASEDYTPKTGDDFKSETFESPDINPEAKEFQLKEDFTASDEYTGPEAATKAGEIGFNPRTVATSSNPDDLVGNGVDQEGAEATVKDATGRSADSIREEQGGMADGETETDKGSGADEVTKASKTSTDEEPRRVRK